MPDMLVKLYELPYDKTLFDNLEKENISVRRAKAPEKKLCCWMDSRKIWRLLGKRK